MINRGIAYVTHFYFSGFFIMHNFPGMGNSFENYMVGKVPSQKQQKRQIYCNLFHIMQGKWVYSTSLKTKKINKFQVE